jgi:TPR repeat protein
MKSRFVFFALLAGAATASATPSANAILTLLNTDAAQNPKVYAAAAARVRSEAEAGKTLQRFVLAVLSADPACPRGIRLDPGTRHAYLESARPRIRQLAEKWNNPLAWYLISLEKNDFGALRRAADGGNVQALNALGTFRLQEALATPGPSTNALAAAAEAFACFRRAAGRNDANALYNLGMCYLQGYGCPIDQRLAFESFRTAADAGHTEAINNIGGCYRDGIVVTRDPVLAARWFAKSAELGTGARSCGSGIV